MALLTTTGAGDVNGILLAVLIVMVVAAALIWWSPRGAESLALLLRARAEALRAARTAYRKAFDEVRGTPRQSALLRARADAATRPALSRE